MGLPSVDVELQSGGLGLVASSDDRVVGMIFNGYGDSTPAFPVYSYADFLSKVGLLLAEPTQVLNQVIDQQVLDFYTVAGDGYELWIKTVAPEKPTAIIFTGVDAANLVQASGGRVNVIGVSRTPLAAIDAPARAEGFLADIVNAMDEAQAFANNMAVQHMPVRIILDGCYAAADLSTLVTQKTKTFNRVAVCIASKAVGSLNACLGLLMGRIAAIPVNRNIGRVKDGSVPVDRAAFTNGTAVDMLTMGALNAIHNKGFIFLRKFVGKSGYYWNDDHTATADTDDYFSLANGRMIDKVSRLVYSTYLEELLDNVLVDEKTGKIAPTVLKNYQGKAERAIRLNMQTAGEISGVKAFIDPTQDILATSHLYIDVRIVPTGTNRAITVRLGLYNPLAA